MPLAVAVLAAVTAVRSASAVDMGPDASPPPVLAERELLIDPGQPAVEPASPLLAMNLSAPGEDGPATTVTTSSSADDATVRLIHIVEHYMRSNACAMICIPFNEIEAQRREDASVPEDDVAVVQVAAQLPTTLDELSAKEQESKPAVDTSNLFLETLEYVGQFGDGEHGNASLITISFNDARMTIDLASLATDRMAMF